jgi:hypothetical protein
MHVAACDAQIISDGLQRQVGIPQVLLDIGSNAHAMLGEQAGALRTCIRHRGISPRDHLQADFCEPGRKLRSQLVFRARPEVS